MVLEEIWLVPEKQEDLGFNSNNIVLSTDLTPTLVVSRIGTSKLKCMAFTLHSCYSLQFVSRLSGPSEIPTSGSTDC
ncbi:hypothetical protein M0802_006270 [Mischocyttarus mexicanus]|nr:hypothetical protein M0802_006270 [Mischocyttarus mexicanus]